MSGGSYDYLFSKDVGDLFDNAHTLERMARRLAEFGFAEDAAAETEETVLILRQVRIRLQTRINRLRGVWQAVEWCDSNDWSESSVKEALTKYRGEA